MSKVVLDISTPLDGFVAGPSPTLEIPLGQGGEQLHEWAFGLASWRASHGLEGGEESADSDLLARGLVASRAVVMGGGCSAAARGRGPRTRTRLLVGGRSALPQARVRSHAPEREPLELGENVLEPHADRSRVVAATRRSASFPPCPTGPRRRLSPG